MSGEAQTGSIADKQEAGRRSMSIVPHAALQAHSSALCCWTLIRIQLTKQNCGLQLMQTLRKIKMNNIQVDYGSINQEGLI